MWLSIITARKRDPQWEGGWMIQEILSSINAKISDGQRSRVHHIYCFRHSQVIPQQVDPSCAPTKSNNRWPSTTNLSRYCFSKSTGNRTNWALSSAREAAPWSLGVLNSGTSFEQGEAYVMWLSIWTSGMNCVCVPFLFFGDRVGWLLWVAVVSVSCCWLLQVHHCYSS